MFKYTENNSKSTKKIFKLCLECGKKYPFDINYCSQCKGYLIPVPYND